MKHAHGFLALDRKLAALERLPDEREVQVALLAGAAIIRDEEQRLAPSRTGGLRGDIVVSTQPVAQWGEKYVRLPVDGQSVFVGPVALRYYAFFLEFGTYKDAPQAFVRPAVDARGAEALTVISAELRRLVMRLAA